MVDVGGGGCLGVLFAGGGVDWWVGGGGGGVFGGGVGSLPAFSSTSGFTWWLRLSSIIIS